MKGGQCANVETNALRLCCSEHIYIQFELSTQVVFTSCLYLHLVFSRHVGIARFRKKKKKKNIVLLSYWGLGSLPNTDTIWVAWGGGDGNF